ncbi:DNA polymerase processivity subunit [Equid gammaherpesvirus 2]|nr:DNA polymerase processivity subunit [Equid gammaherpesvirus 2]
MAEEMEETHCMALNVENFKACAKIHNHVKNYLKKGLVQIVGFETEPVFQIMATACDGGILVFKVLNPFESFNVSYSRMETLSLSFKNQPHGNTYLYSKDLFGEAVKGASLTFLQRPGLCRPDFVRSDVLMDDDVTTSSHCTSLTSWSPPANDIRAGTVMSKVVLSIKTCTMLQKWLKDQKSKGEPRCVRLCLNEILSVLVLSVGEASKTVHLKPVEGNPATSLLFADKQGDVCIISDDEAHDVSLDSLLAALGVCRIPALCLPCFNFHSNGVLEVVGLQFKSSKPASGELSVFLLRANPQVDFNGVPEGDVQTQEVSSVASTCRHLSESCSLDPPRTPELPGSPDTFKEIPGRSGSVHLERDLSCSDSEEETPRQKPAKAKPAAAPKRSEKRKREGGKKGPKAKSLKLTFNPLI